MEKSAFIKRRGNPNFTKKSENNATETTGTNEVSEPKDDLNKQYVFQLLKTHDKAKPRDPNTNELTTSPYQPFWAAVNSGIAWDPDYTPKGSNTKGAQRRWRFMHNYPTIWVDEQIDPLPTKEDLAAAENDLTFRQGVLRVFGYETMKLKALYLNNGYKDCERPLKNVPKDFELLDQEKIDKTILKTLDDQFEAEKAAREATLDEMYAVGYYFGIDLSKSDDAIRKEFISKARQMPAVFNREFVNPKNKYKYRFLEALADNLISGAIVPGKIHWVETNVPLFDLKTTDVAEELATLAIGGYEKAVNLYNKVDKVLKEEPEEVK